MWQPLRCHIFSSAVVRGCRILLSVFFVPALLHGQGMGSGVKAVARGSAKANIDLPAPAIEFRDISASTGITAPNVYGGATKKKYIIEMNGNGAGIFDFDNDGWRDVFLVNGDRLEASPDSSKPASHLYRNQGDGTFADVTKKAGLDRPGWGQGVCAGDYDNDGNTDLLVTYYGHNVLYRNRGDGTFADVTELSGMPVTGQRWATGCAFLDYNLDGKLDLFVSNYLGFDMRQAMAPGSSPYCSWAGLPVFCGPRGFPGGHNILYRNDGAGHFKDVSKEAGILSSEMHYNLGVVSSDFDNDGWPDVFVACDSTPGRLYLNNKDGSFTDVGVTTGVAYGESGQEEGSMGVAAADYDNNGWLDILIANFMNETATLYRNAKKLLFQDVTYAAGLGVNTTFVNWGAQFLDVDQDGWKDILISNGHIYPELMNANTGEDYRQRKILYWNLRNGAFRDITKNAGKALTEPNCSRGMAAGDLDGDGVPEVVVVNMNAPPTVLKNTGEKGNAILVELIGSKSNRSAIGGRVTVVTGQLTQLDEVRSGSSYASQNDFRLHFGLGKASAADRLLVRWPGGAIETFENVKANQWLTIREGKGIVKQQPFRSSVH